MPGHDDQMGTRAGPPHHAHLHRVSGCRVRRGLDIDRPDPRGITPHRPRRQSHRLGPREMGHRRGQLETVRDVLKLQARRRTRLGQLVPQRRLTRRPRVQRSQHRGAHHHRANCQHRARQTPAPPQPPNQQPTTSTRATHPHRSSDEGPARSGTALHAGRAAHPRGAQQARGSECGLTQHAHPATRCATAIEGGGPWAARLAWAAWGLSRPAVTAPRARPRPSSKRGCVTTRTAWRSRRPATE